MQIVILAAGMGTRLGKPFPKSLTPLKDGRTILAQQLANVRSVFGRETEILIVVGFKLEQILEAAPDVTFAYNELFDQTNTSKSLLKALALTSDRGVLWMNGDVVFHPDILRRMQEHINRDQSIVCTNTATVAEEEVKYRTNEEGYICELSKQVRNAQGEAIGINFVSSSDKPLLLSCLSEVDAQEYFEGGIELAIERHGMQILPLDISDLYAVEVDFAEDLAKANEAI